MNMGTIFVSGHMDLTPEEFATHYLVKLKEAIAQGDSFVVGDAPGCDEMVQRFLAHNGAGSDRVHVYHMLQAPRRHVAPFPTRGGYESDEARDSAMTTASDTDIAWVRHGKSRKNGTRRNLERRSAVHHEEARRLRKEYPRVILEQDWIDVEVLRVQDYDAKEDPDSHLYERSTPVPPELLARYREAVRLEHEAAREVHQIERELRLWASRQESDPV